MPFNPFDTTVTVIAACLLWMAGGLWFYSMFGYPLLMALWGTKKHPVPEQAPSELPSVTLIVPAHNEEAVIEAKLKNALSLDYPHHKLNILVTSDGSNDATVPISQRYACDRLRILDFQSRRGKTSIVNDAVVQATGQALCLCDANVMFESSALKKLVNRLVDERVGAVSGDVRLASHESDFGSGESLYYRYERASQLGESALGSMMGVDGGMYVIRRSLFKPPPAETILDDFVISMQVVLNGHKVVYEPSAIANENGTPSSEVEFRRRVRVTAGAVQTIRWGLWPSPFKYPVAFFQWFSHKLLRWLSPIILLLILGCCALLWNSGVIYRIALLAQLAVYGLAAIAWLVPRLRSAPLVGLCYYFVLSHVAMLLGIYRGIRNQQKVTWSRTQRAAAS